MVVGDKNNRDGLDALYKKYPLKYEKPRISKKKITKLARPYRIGFALDSFAKAFHDFFQCITGVSNRRH